MFTWAGCWPAACLSERNSGSASCSDLVTEWRSSTTSQPVARWWCAEAQCAWLAERWWRRWNSRWDAVRRRETELMLGCYQTDRSQTETAPGCNPTHTHTSDSESERLFTWRKLRRMPYLFGSQHDAYDFEVHGLVFPHAAQDVFTCAGAGVAHQKLSVSRQQMLRTLHTHTLIKQMHALISTDSEASCQ